MYGDSAVIGRRTGEVREQAVDLRVLADRLVAGADALEWPGRASASLRERMRERAAQLREVAARHETAADSLLAHAKEADRLREAIAQIERKAGTLGDDARARADRLAQADDGLERRVSAADQRLLDFEPPPSGHKDWLDVELPGL